ncbi:histidine phosphatase family protein [Pseudomonas sp. FW306-02-F02-AA]|uniref:Phosphoglycerate mutase n=1 Tax=Pseudomonas fluorescens TaxID=294 RepID=A0A0N7H142_PSEFL|nr:MULTISPECIES: histidine phosphatase family protein [Pseudomonas]ALI04892.1 phosphoglycerate mutase [Pseudomonas fluorescens]PMZ05614.1 histidine phosphatase family protein [Pseudomonas sp. FW306-02-F02-AB]PMZ11183.1 histidine phosphatase family protein [Pseudomonas sp. FW306-02-H06C]PMZ17138.1 histidine phosphatase family protein [Pseudomonas sp. FW306-02-F02-AA]PMZ23384.1 histidine phosphatase family protein [Pseudomonas sp. FW306-02-F08-AA]
MQSTRLTLICHARTAAQKLARFAEDESVDMDWQNAKGSLAKRFKRAPRLLSAPEARTRETAALFGADMEIVPALRDCDLGRWKGLRINDLQRDEPELLHAWLSDSTSAAHGGESVAQLCERTAAWLETLVNQPGHLLAVTHPFVIRAALMHVMQCPPALFNAIDVEPLAAVELRYNGRWRLRLTPA